MRGAPQPAARGAAGEGTRTQRGARNVWRARRARIESRTAGRARASRRPIKRHARRSRVHSVPGTAAREKKAPRAKIARAKLIAGGCPRETFIQ